MDLKRNQITVGELLDHPGARAVFQRRFPMLMKHPMLGAARTITPVSYTHLTLPTT